MDYEFWFWILICALVFYKIGAHDGPIIYVGSDKEKYDKALFGIKL